jgi:hypothetical protein
MQFLRALSILGSLVVLSIALGIYFEGSLFLWIIGAWILSAPVILLDAWVRNASDDKAVKFDRPTALTESATAVQPAVQELARRRADE